MDSAPDPHNSQLEDYEAKRSKKGTPTEFSANQKPGGDAKKRSKALTGMTGPSIPDEIYVGFVTKHLKLFNTHKLNADENAAGVQYFKIVYADPTGGKTRGRYWSAIANGNRGAYKALGKEKRGVFYRLANYSLETAVIQLKDYYTVGELNDIKASPEYKFYKMTVDKLTPDMFQLAVLVRGASATTLHTEKVYAKNASRAEKELRRRLRVKRL